MDLNHLLHEHQVALMRANRAPGPEAKLIQDRLARAYAGRIAELRDRSDDGSDRVRRITDASPPHPDPEASTKPGRKPFRRKFQAERPSPEQMERQGRLVCSAWAALGDRNAVMTFLNTYHEAIGGRPINVALASGEGFGQGRGGVAGGVVRARL